ncbi:MAG: hypothetical protein F6K14_31270 [Symploca sp. SIO2C1]|nr:hypothetical protein [Symploca sp. SIO2C1]
MVTSIEAKENAAKVSAVRRKSASRRERLHLGVGKCDRTLQTFMKFFLDTSDLVGEPFMVSLSHD